MQRQLLHREEMQHLSWLKNDIEGKGANLDHFLAQQLARLIRRLPPNTFRSGHWRLYLAYLDSLRVDIGRAKAGKQQG
jgi:hypothetical protein